MVAFISIFEVTILWLFLAVPTAIAYLRYRHRRRKSNATKSENLLLALGATVFGAAYIGIGFVAELLPTQPDKMLSRFLKVEYISEFSDLRSDFVGGLDYTAWIYFQTSNQRFNRLVADLEFRRLPDGDHNQGLIYTGFAGAPPLPSPEQAVVYSRLGRENHDIQYLVTNSDHDRGWFVSLDY